MTRPAKHYLTAAGAAALAAALLTSLASGLLSAQTRPTSAPTDLVVRVLLEESDGTLTPAAEAYVWMASHGAQNADDQRTIVDWPAGSDAPVIVPAGATIQFRRRRDLAHRLFSADPDRPFDVDLTSTRTTADLRLSRTGAVTIYCDDHATERVELVVTRGPHYRTDAAGRAVLPRLGHDRHIIEAWHPRGAGSRRSLQLVASELVVRIPVRSPQAHRNRQGRRYPPPPGSIVVRVERLPKGASKPAAGAVVWLQGSPTPDRPGYRAESIPALAIGARDKRFAPRVAAVPVGTTVDFPNHDRIFHNVFSLSSAKRFDLGLYRNGKSKSVTFDEPGIVQVFCNIHPQMAAYVIVVDGRSHAVTGDDGRVTLGGVRPGSYRLRVWDERGGEHEETVTITSNVRATADVSLDAGDWRAVKHRNKHGERYPDPDDEESRY